MKRRAILGGGIAALAALAAGAAWRFPHLFGWRPTPYDDLLSQIVDRAPAAALGEAARAARPGFDDPRTLALVLRQPGFALATRAPQDAAAGRVVEVSGWILPETVAAYAALAAHYA